MYKIRDKDESRKVLDKDCRPRNNGVQNVTKKRYR